MLPAPLAESLSHKLLKITFFYKSNIYIESLRYNAPAAPIDDATRRASSSSLLDDGGDLGAFLPKHSKFKHNKNANTEFSFDFLFFYPSVMHRTAASSATRF